MKRIAIVCAVLVVLAAAGAIVAYTLAPKNVQPAQATSGGETDTSPSPDTSSETYQEFNQLKGEEYDRVYVANMIAHHLGEISLAKVAEMNAERPETKSMAETIMASRVKELETLMVWQKKWGYPSSVGDNMIDHSAMLMDAKMAMASEKLIEKSGAGFDRGFIDALAGFHQTALDMSSPAEANAVHIEVKMFANSSMMTYAKELTDLKSW